MLHTRCALSRLLALVLVFTVLCLSGCAQNSSKEPEATEPIATTAPSTPTDPTDPIELTAHEKLYNHLMSSGAVIVEETAYTFTMRADSGKILWEYKNESASVTVTLSDGAATHPVAITFAIYNASAEIDAATYSGAERKLSNFRCNAPTMAESIGNWASTAVWICFTQAAKAMEPSGVTLTSLGFTNYEG